MQAVVIVVVVLVVLVVIALAVAAQRKRAQVRGTTASEVGSGHQCGVDPTA